MSAPPEQRRVLAFDHTPTPQEIVTRLIEAGDVADAIVLQALVHIAHEQGSPVLLVKVDAILETIEALGLLSAWEAAHGTEESEGETRE